MKMEKGTEVFVGTEKGSRNHGKGRTFSQMIFVPKKIAASVRRLFGAAVYSRRVGISKYRIPWKVLPGNKQGAPPNVMR